MTTMMNELTSAREFLRRCFPGDGRVLCAVSGGLDSMCLLHFVSRQPGLTVAAAHFNHRLRDTAGRDEAFVRDWCAGRDIPFFAGDGDVAVMARKEGLSVEEAARRARYAFLENTAAEGGFDAILTAHHADDNAETVLLNLIRGTGTAGLAGIPRVRGNILRPFLETSRAELAAYAAAHDIPHVEDETNTDPDAAARNRLRLQVMPLLKEINPAAAENIAAAAAILARESEAMEAVAAQLAEKVSVTAEGVSVPCDELLTVPGAVAERAVLQLLALAAGKRKDISASHVKAVLELAERGDDGWAVALPCSLTARKTDGILRICRETKEGSVPLLPGEPVRWGGYLLTLLEHPAGEGLSLREPRPEESVTVKPCEPGAYMTLPGARGARSIKRLCTDRRIRPEERDRLPAIYVNDHPAAVWRLGTDINFLPVGEACRFIQIMKETEENDHGQ